MRNPNFTTTACTVPKIWHASDFILILSNEHNSRKGDNSDKKKYGLAIFPWGIHIWNVKTIACTVHKIYNASDFILILSKGHNSRKGDHAEKTWVSCFFSWGIYIWNFKTVACTVNKIWHESKTVMDARTDGRTDNPKTICPPPSSTSSKLGA